MRFCGETINPSEKEGNMSTRNEIGPEHTPEVLAEYARRQSEAADWIRSAQIKRGLDRRYALDYPRGAVNDAVNEAMSHWLIKCRPGADEGGGNELGRWVKRSDCDGNWETFWEWSDEGEKARATVLDGLKATITIESLEAGWRKEYEHVMPEIMARYK